MEIPTNITEDLDNQGTHLTFLCILFKKKADKKF